MNRARVVLRFPLSERDLGEALRLRRETAAPIVVKPRATMLPPPPDRPYVLRSVPPQPVRELTVAPSLPTMAPPKRGRAVR